MSCMQPIQHIVNHSRQQLTISIREIWKFVPDVPDPRFPYVQ
jgi:hypothetical protein